MEATHVSDLETSNYKLDMNFPHSLGGCRAIRAEAKIWKFETRI